MNIFFWTFSPFFITFCNILTARCETPPLEPIDYTLGISGTIGTAGLMLTSLMFVEDPHAVLVSTSAKMFFYIKYLSIVYDPEYFQRLVAQRTTTTTLDFRIKMTNTASKRFTQSLLPFSLARYNMQSSFIVNFWPRFLTLVIIFGLIALLKAFEWIASKISTQSFSNIVFKRLRVPTQNLFFMVFYDAYPDIVYFSLIDFKFTKVKSGFDGFSFSLSTIFLLGGMVLFWSHAKILTKQHKLLKQTGQVAQRQLTEFFKQYETIQILYKGFQVSSVLHQSYLLILTGRAILISIILAALFEYPLAQVILLLISNIIMGIYILVERPIKGAINKVQQLIAEILFFTINIGLLVLATLDHLKEMSVDTRNKTGSFLVFVNLFYNFLVIIILVIKIIAYFRYKARNEVSKAQTDGNKFQTVKSLPKSSPSNQTNSKVKIKQKEEPYSFERLKFLGNRRKLQRTDNSNLINESVNISIDQSFQKEYSNRPLVLRDHNPENSIIPSGGLRYQEKEEITQKHEGETLFKKLRVTKFIDNFNMIKPEHDAIRCSELDNVNETSFKKRRK